MMTTPPATGHRSQWWPCDGYCGTLHEFHCSHEGKSNQPARSGQRDHLSSVLDGEGKCRKDGVDVMSNAKGAGHPIADQRGDETREQQAATPNTADGWYFQCEQRARNRRTEHGAESGGDGDDQKSSPISRRAPSQASELVAQPGRNLDRNALPPCRSTEELRGHRGDQDERRHTTREERRRLVNLVQHEVVAASRSSGAVVIGETDNETCERQQPQQPVVLISASARPRQAMKERRRSRTGNHTDDDRRQQRLHDAAQAFSHSPILVGLCTCERTHQTRRHR